MRIHALLIGAGGVLASTLLAVSAQAPPLPGDALSGTTPREFEEFRIGLEDFREIEEPGEGLGPLFNGTGCASCHNVPVIGGGSPMTEMRAAGRDAQAGDGLTLGIENLEQRSVFFCLGLREESSNADNGRNLPMQRPLGQIPGEAHGMPDARRHPSTVMALPVND